MIRMLLLGLGFVAPTTAAAQQLNFGALDNHTNAFHVQTGVENGFVGTVGYSRVFRVADRPVVLTGDLTMPYTAPDLGEIRVRAGGQIPIVGRGSPKLVVRAMPALWTLNTLMVRMTGLGADLGVMGGYYRPKWFVAGELGVDLMLSTHIKHSDLYRSSIYSDAQNGWYAATGGSFAYGAMGGLSLGRVDLVLRLGQARDLATAKTSFLPAYASLGANVRW